ncbi:Signal transduction histidine kinase [Chitinophaga sp. CF118]|nr:Signal transduction histidine kinase [Chitinophaga sp. CF118]
MACLVIPLVLVAQDSKHNFNKYTTVNGLPTNSIQYVYADSYGFLWLASFDGLLRWDGYSFKTYSHDENDPRTPDNNIINSIYEDSQRRLWVATIDGLCLYDRSMETFVRCRIRPDKGKVSVNAILEDTAHQLWLGTSMGLCHYDHNTRKAEWVTTPDGPDVIFCMARDSGNHLWLGTFNRGFQKFSPLTHQFQSFKHKSGDPTTIRSILVDSGNRVWVGTEDKGVAVFNGNGQLIKKIEGLPGKKCIINCIYEDKNRSIWIGIRRERAYCIRSGEMIPSALENTSVNNNYEKISSVTSIHEDLFGNTWFASANDGLYYTNGNKNTFSNYLHGPSSMAVSCFYEDKQGAVWVGTNGNGVFRLGPEKRSVTSPVIPSLPSNVIYDIKGDNEENLWMASWGGGLITCNSSGSNVKQYLHDPSDINSIILNDIKSVLPDDSLIWIGTHGEGLAVFDKKKDRFIHYKNNKTFPFSMHAPAWINHLFKDSRKRLWISAYNGLFVFDGKKLTHFVHSYDSTSISSNSVNMVAEDGDGNIWLVSESGLDQYDEVTGKFRRCILTGPMKSIVANNKTLWIGSTKGIIAFNPVAQTVNRYDLNDGLLDNAFFQKAAMRSVTGNMYFGCPRGFSMFSPASLKKLDIPSYFYFTDLYVNNEQQYPGKKGSPLQKSLSFSDTVILKPEHTFFSIGFEVINLYAPDRIKYSYKLEGLHDKWMTTNGDPRIFFMNLQPGDYTLKIRYTDMNGQWQSASKTLLLKILPAWRQTWWFRSMMFICCVALMTALFYIRLFAVKKRNHILEEEVQRRTIELIEQNDEIRTQKENLTLSNEEINRQTDKILLQQQYIINQNKELESSVKKLKELNQTKDHFFSILAHDLKNPVSALTGMVDFVRVNFQRIDKKKLQEYIEGIHQSATSVYDLLVNLLNWSRTQVNKIAPDPGNWAVAEMIEENRLLLAPQLNKKNIQLESHVNPAHHVFADYNMINVVIRNIFSNSIKFTDYNGSIGIYSAEKDNTIILRITDSGIGMSTWQLDSLFKIDEMRTAIGTAGEKGTGLGLIVSKEFIEANQGSIWVESAAGKGSSFYVQLPVARSRVRYPGKPFHSGLKLDLWETIPVEKLLKIKGKKILIVDDSLEMRNYLKLIISDTFEIFEAPNGEEALKLAIDNMPAIIITDLLMPDMNGLEFCKAIKNQMATSHIPVVFLTSQWDESIQVTGYEAGADIYLTKPVKKELLIQVVLNLLQNQERIHKNILEQLVSNSSLQSVTTNINKQDETFLNKLISAVEANISDSNLDARFLCREMATSRTVLYTKIRTLTGQTVHEFIKSIRLRKSVRLLLEGELSVSQIAFDVGFNSHSYFDRCFIKQYRMGPREYVNMRKGSDKNEAATQSE